MASFKYVFPFTVMAARYASKDDVFGVGKNYGIFGIGMEWPGDEVSRKEFRERLELYRDSDYAYTGYGLVVPAGTEVTVEGFTDELDIIFGYNKQTKIPVFEFPESVLEYNRKNKEAV